MKSDSAVILPSRIDVTKKTFLTVKFSAVKYWEENPENIPCVLNVL